MFFNQGCLSVGTTDAYTILSNGYKNIHIISKIVKMKIKNEFLLFILIVIETSHIIFIMFYLQAVLIANNTWFDF